MKRLITLDTVLEDLEELLPSVANDEESNPPPTRLASLFLSL